MAVAGDFSALAELRARATALASASARARLAQVLAVAALRELNNGFRASRDPYGRAWKPLRRRAGKPLLDTGRMRASAHVYRVGADGFAIRVSAEYSGYHQDGTRHVPQRMMVPTPDRGLGLWGDPLRKVAAEFVEREARRGSR